MILGLFKDKETIELSKKLAVTFLEAKRALRGLPKNKLNEKNIAKIGFCRGVLLPVYIIIRMSLQKYINLQRNLNSKLPALFLLVLKKFSIPCNYLMISIFRLQ